MNKNLETALVGISIFLFLIILFVFIFHNMELPKQNKDNQIVVIKAETEDRLTCPFRCIDSGWDGGEWVKFAKQCVCYNRDAVVKDQEKVK